MQRGIFGAESLFAKIIATTITREQRSKALVRRGKDELARYRADVTDAAATLAIALGLSEEQKRELKKLLNEEIDPPLTIGESDRSYILLRLYQLPEAKVKPIFSAAKWQLLCKIRSSGAMRN